MEHAEAVVLHVLASELLDVCLKELECGLVGLQRVPQVVFLNLPGRILQELSNGLGTGLTLKVLSCNNLVKHCLYLHVLIINAQGLDNPDQHRLHSLQIPVLVYACPDD